ncbi:MAG TPA: hypothetical protein VFF90_02905 [Saprospiraceae bacterium]|nr:hypothetical protein [Saprospiraceae bacterium]
MQMTILMKNTLISLALYLLLPIDLMGQLTFEEVISPKEYNVISMLKSPQSEYFTQPANNSQVLFSSTDRLNWTRIVLPVRLDLEKAQYFSDGTVLLQSDGAAHLIRRQGIWETMTMPGHTGLIRASFIKDDSLFVYHDQVFAYSLDKGASFTPVFTLPDPISFSSIHLFKFENHFLLYYRGGTIHEVSVFDQTGNSVQQIPITLSLNKPFSIIDNECGELMITGDSLFHLWRGNGLDYSTGNITDIIPTTSYFHHIQSVNGYYYYRAGQKLYKSNGCNFDWSIMATHISLSTSDNLTVGFQDEVLLYDDLDNAFIERASGSNDWPSIQFNIAYALVSDVDESRSGKQIAVTSNSYFRKTVPETDFIKISGDAHLSFTATYTPDDDLYLGERTRIRYSKTNGLSSTFISLPDITPFDEDYLTFVLDNDIIYIVEYLEGRSFYTLNNGQQWIEANVPDSIYSPIVRLVDDQIVIADFYKTPFMTALNIHTNQSITANMGSLPKIFQGRKTISADGTLYFQSNQSLNGPAKLYSCRAGEASTLIGEFPQLNRTNDLIAIGNDLYAFSSTGYYFFDGTTFVQLSYSGLPEGSTRFTLAENGHLYSISSSHGIFRSLAPQLEHKRISGSVYFDEDQNCVPNPDASKFSEWTVRLEGNNFTRTRPTDTEGKFSFDVPPGTYQLTAIPPSILWQLCENTYSILVHDSDSVIQQNFFANSDGHCAEMQLNFSTPFLRRCDDNTYYVTIRNAGPLATVSTILTMTMDSVFEIVSSVLPFSQSGQDILFDLGSLAVNQEVTFSFVVHLSCDANLGDEHCMTGLLEDPIDCNPLNTLHTECQVNSGPFDPNDKRIFSAAGREISESSSEEFIYYHVRFQNTGTDTAFNVRIVDTLSAHLNVNTLEVLGASHTYKYTLAEDSILFMQFDNIGLPDSTINEAASNGYFVFRIKPWPDVTFGTEIANRANIYFDFNEVVRTNEAILVIMPPVNTKAPFPRQDFTIFPVPAYDFIKIGMELDGERNYTYTIANSLGNKCGHSHLLNSMAIDIAHLVPGIYVLMLEEEGLIVGVGKFIKM